MSGIFTRMANLSNLSTPDHSHPKQIFLTQNETPP